jgi:hypothetical protein
LGEVVDLGTGGLAIGDTDEGDAKLTLGIVVYEAAGTQGFVIGVGGYDNELALLGLPWNRVEGVPTPRGCSGKGGVES